MSDPFATILQRGTGACEVRPWRGKAVVLGKPATKGSVRAFVPKGGKHPVVINDNPRGKSWQQELSLAMRETRPRLPLRGAVRVDLLVYLQRPKGHYGSGRNAARLRESAPAFPTVKPDIDKILRAALDAGTGIWFADDAQIVGGEHWKLWCPEGESPRTEVVAVELVGGELLRREVGDAAERSEG